MTHEAHHTDNHKDKIKTTINKDHSKKKYICAICDLTLSSRQALFKHKKRKHKGNTSVQHNSNHSCHCQMCTEFQSFTIKELIAHYQKKTPARH